MAAAQATPARARVLIRTIIVLPAKNLNDNFQDISPSPTQRPECSHRRPGRIGACLRELILGGEQLAIGVENIRQRDHAALVGFLRSISCPLQCGDLGGQLLLVSLELHQRRECILDIFGGAQHRMLVAGECLSLGSPGLGHFGAHFAEIEHPPAQSREPLLTGMSQL